MSPMHNDLKEIRTFEEIEAEEKLLRKWEFVALAILLPIGSFCVAAFGH